MKDELPRLPSEAYIKGREDACKKLRDEFAGLAMQAIISNSGFDIDEAISKDQADQCVSDAYYIADKMMEAKK